MKFPKDAHQRRVLKTLETLGFKNCEVRESYFHVKIIMEL